MPEEGLGALYECIQNDLLGTIIEPGRYNNMIFSYKSRTGCIDRCAGTTYIEGQITSVLRTRIPG